MLVIRVFFYSLHIARHPENLEGKQTIDDHYSLLFVIQDK
jgi:hypothetical protein